MVSKKGLTVLVIVAIVLAITAISLRLLGSDEVPTSAEDSQTPGGAGKVGVTILPTDVEDKLADNSGGNQG